MRPLSPPARTAATRRPGQLRPGLVALVAAGGVVGAAARQVVEQAVPAGRTGFPVATFAINLSGAAVLGALLEALAAAGPDTGWRLRARLLLGVGVCGAFTTWSTLAVEVVQLGRHGHGALAAAYLLASVGGGLLAAAAGIAAAGGTRRAWRVAPAVAPTDVDPDRGP